MAEARRFDVLVVGAGPAGLAAAACAADGGAHVALVDDNPHPGGQIWRHDLKKPLGTAAEGWRGVVHHPRVTFLAGIRFIAQTGPKRLRAETPSASLDFDYGKLILATGARERFLPFPGWTLPGVLGAGGLQALAKGGWPVAGQRVVVAGSGPLLLAVAAYLKKAKAKVFCVAEQAPTKRVNAFARSLLWSPAKLLQGATLRTTLWNVPYRTGCWPTEALGTQRLEAVRLRDEQGRAFELPCDYLACGFGLVPNTELAQLLRCGLKAGAVAVDELQRTTLPDHFAAGELTGVGGLDKSLLEGQVAGHAAAGNLAEARHLLPAVAAARRFATKLETTFALRPELKSLPTPETVACRCEDVPFGALAGYASWRAAKLQTRCGMGPCQGRVCGPLVEFHFGWLATSVRPPLLPARLGSLCPDSPSPAFGEDR